MAWKIFEAMSKWKVFNLRTPRVASTGPSGRPRFLPFFPKRFFKSMEHNAVLQPNERLESAKEYLALVDKRPELTQKQWKKKSDKLLKRATGVGLFRRTTGEQRATKEYLKLLRDEALKTPEARAKETMQRMQSNWSSPSSTPAQPAPSRTVAASYGRQGSQDALDLISDLYGAGGALHSIGLESDGRIVFRWENASGAARTSFVDGRIDRTAAELARQFKALLDGRAYVEAHELGLHEVTEQLRKHVESKHKASLLDVASQITTATMFGPPIKYSPAAGRP